MLPTIETYLRQIETALKHGDATEHTHRPFLKTLIESFGEKITATNEPKQKNGNAPDFIVLRERVPVGHVEAKDVGVSLAAVEKSEQLKRYRKSLNNLILTNYLEFVWYENGELRNSIKLARAMPDGSVISCIDGDSLLETIFRQFFETEVPVVTSAEDLAVRMAARARELEASVEKVLKKDASQALKGLMAEFKRELIPGLDDDKFADMYTQTLAYGLFTACYFLRSSKKDPSTVFDRQSAFASLPKSNPFLKRMFQTVAGFDLDEEPFVWAVDNIAALLNRADMSAIMENFGRGKDDPVIHFYETFLQAYDPKLRELRGVYYTPTPVVGYITRSVDQILKRDFGLTDGIASNEKIKESDSHKVLILDPATGTGTFLANVIDLIYSRYHDNKGMWTDYVRDGLLPRLFGFEFLVAPYSIAHLKLGMKLADTGFEFEDGERLNVFLTNTLEEAQTLADGAGGGMGYWIHEEAAKAQKIKKDAPVMVILGNPPYSGHSANTGKWIHDLLRGIEIKDTEKLPTESYFEVDGKPLGERNLKWLNNDYVKFIRFSQWRIEQTGYGILAFITSNSYLDSPTFRGMRESLMNTFDDIYILDLHGNSKKKEKAPDGSPDQNVFDITEGVAIGIFVKKRAEFKLSAQNETKAEPPDAKVYHYDLFGVREVYERSEIDGERACVGGKYKYLRENDKTTTTWEELEPTSPYYLLVPQNKRVADEYQRGWNLQNAMTENSLGTLTKRDSLVIEQTENVLIDKLSSFLDPAKTDIDATSRFGLQLSDRDMWDAAKARKSLSTKEIHKFVRKETYRPFDERFIFLHPSFVARLNSRIMGNFSNDNIGILLGRQGIATNDLEWNLAFSCNQIIDQNAFRRGGATVFPLYLYDPEQPTIFTPPPANGVPIFRKTLCLS